MTCRLKVSLLLITRKESVLKEAAGMIDEMDTIFSTIKLMGKDIQDRPKFKYIVPKPNKILVSITSCILFFIIFMYVTKQ